ncbi:IclR family transcriptional regulator [Streptosporangium amethystogenes]|uniref:IclR family transcriptional regulator n=1 Tax=Streptosporangium amethystogenes TaxID=2002 RepID=UPI0012FBA7B8|nr:IclR family transcriptional regulator [Streptosporangium amethystogenes]
MARRTAKSSGQPTDSAGRAKPTLQGVSRALRVMELLSQQPMRASEAAEALGMSWATLHRTLSQLEADQFLERDASGVFRIGRRTWLLGSTYLVGHRLLELAIPLMNRATQDTPFAVFQLVERSEGTAVVLYSHEALSGEIITRTTYGYHFPLHTGSKGHVLLAYEPDEFIEEYLAGDLIALTPGSITDPKELREVLATVRKQGYAVTMGDVQTFTGSVSAPVFDSEGAVVAAVCAVVSRAHLDGGRNQVVVTDAVQRLAQALSLGIGWQPMRNLRYQA